MSDEALREIQLNGKQLVFLFMAATVVAVVIFLCGVMVGRGVRAPVVEQADTISAAPVDPTVTTEAKAAPAGTDSAPATTRENFTYPNRLEGDAPPPETLEEVPEDPTSPRTAAAPPATTPRDARTGKTPAAKAPVPAPTAAAPVAAAAVAANDTPAEPAGNGYVVQVAATKERSEAETIAKRLVNKGYQAFVTTPASGPKMFRVRVGKFSDRKEADRIAGRLQREEQFKPWVTR